MYAQLSNWACLRDHELLCLPGTREAVKLLQCRFHLGLGWDGAFDGILASSLGRGLYVSCFLWQFLISLGLSSGLGLPLLDGPLLLLEHVLSAIRNCSKPNDLPVHLSPESVHFSCVLV